MLQKGPRKAGQVEWCVFSNFVASPNTPIEHDSYVCSKALDYWALSAHFMLCTCIDTLPTSTRRYNHARHSSQVRVRSGLRLLRISSCLDINFSSLLEYSAYLTSLISSPLEATSVAISTETRPKNVIIRTEYYVIKMGGERKQQKINNKTKKKTTTSMVGWEAHYSGSSLFRYDS